MQIFETNDREKFNNFLISQNASVLQSWEWGDFQKKLGRKVWRLLLTTNTDKMLGAATIVRMPLPRGMCYLYCYRGPVFVSSPITDKIWQLFLDKIQDLVVLEKPIFLRVDPQIEFLPRNFNLSSLGFRKLPWEVQPKETQILELSGNEADLLHRMKPKTRYNINLAERKGIVVEKFTDGKRMRDFWELMRQTTKRDNFSAHPYVYYLNLVETLGKGEAVELFLAIYNKRPLAGAIVSYFGDAATYLHGASSDRMRAIMAPYLVQWSAIKSAKEKGMNFYDFGGIAPARSSSRHSWFGITRFKKGFGGKEVSYVGAFDLPFNRIWYGIYRMARKINRTI